MLAVGPRPHSTRHCHTEINCGVFLYLLFISLYLSVFMQVTRGRRQSTTPRPDLHCLSVRIGPCCFHAETVYGWIEINIRLKTREQIARLENVFYTPAVGPLFFSPGNFQYFIFSVPLENGWKCS